MIDFLVGNDLIASIIAFALVLIPAIIIHELGHFLAAKAVGITVLEFGIGFPPRLAKLFNWGETEFTLNLIPLGGFVRPLGEDLIAPLNETDAQVQREAFLEGKPKNDEDQYVSERDELRNRGLPDTQMMSVNEAKPISRIIFMSAGAIANFVSAIALFIIIGLIGIPQFVGARFQVIDIPANSEFARQGVQSGDAIEKINGEFFLGNGDFFTRVQSNSEQYTSLTMLNIESGENYEVSIPTSALISKPYVLITGIQEDSPAHIAGFEPKDLITSVNGVELSNIDDPISEVQEASVTFAGQELALTILRDGEEIDITVVPRVNPRSGEGRIGINIRPQYMSLDGASFIQVADQEELIPLSFSESLEYGLSSFGDVIRTIISIPSELIRGTITPEQARPVSIIGISQFGGQLIQQSVEQGSPTVILRFIALVSIFLGVTNLLPIPALDGGRILFVVIEIIRGKPVPPALEGRIHLIGIIILLSIGVLVMLYDVINPVTIQ